MSEPTVRVENISRFFQDKKRGIVRAVDSLSFEVKAGEIVAILGPNGAGKTTTLRAIGYLPSESGLYHRLTPYEVISLFGRLVERFIKEERDKAKAIILSTLKGWRIIKLIRKF